MKTKKIIKIHSVSPKKEGYPNRFYNLEMDNGDKINILKRDGLTEGKTITYELTGEDDGQQEFKKAKNVQNPQQQSNSFDPDLSLQQTCLHVTGAILSSLSMSVPSEKQVAEYAKNLFKELKNR